jgi:CRP/FNR family cyclic AMP-dependent transcriptional regulator
VSVRPQNPALPILKSISYFRSLPARELARLATRCQTRALQPGQLLFEEGAPCTGLFMIATGHIDVRQVSYRGREQIFHTEGPGATLGEGPLFDGGGYIASAVASEPTTVLFLRRADLLDLCRRHPIVALRMLESLARRVRRFAEIIADLAFRPVSERLARYIDEAGKAQPGTRGAEVQLELTQAQLAARLGTVRELIARAFADLEREGIIARRGRRIVIRDPARLASIARGER